MKHGPDRKPMLLELERQTKTQLAARCQQIFRPYHLAIFGGEDSARLRSICIGIHEQLLQHVAIDNFRVPCTLEQLRELVARSYSGPHFVGTVRLNLPTCTIGELVEVDITDPNVAVALWGATIA